MPEQVLGCDRFRDLVALCYRVRNVTATGENNDHDHFGLQIIDCSRGAVIECRYRYAQSENRLLPESSVRTSGNRSAQGRNV